MALYSLTTVTAAEVRVSDAATGRGVWGTGQLPPGRSGRYQGRELRGSQDYLHLLPNFAESWPDFRALASNHVGSKRLRRSLREEDKSSRSQGPDCGFLQPDSRGLGIAGGRERGDALGLRSIEQIARCSLSHSVKENQKFTARL